MSPYHHALDTRRIALNDNGLLAWVKHNERAILQSLTIAGTWQLRIGAVLCRLRHYRRSMSYRSIRCRMDSQTGRTEGELMSEENKPNRFEKALIAIGNGEVSVLRPPANGSGYKSHGLLKKNDQKAIREALKIASQSLNKAE